MPFLSLFLSFFSPLSFSFSFYLYPSHSFSRTISLILAVSDACHLHSLYFSFYSSSIHPSVLLPSFPPSLLPSFHPLIHPSYLLDWFQLGCTCPTWVAYSISQVNHLKYLSMLLLLCCSHNWFALYYNHCSAISFLNISPCVHHVGAMIEGRTMNAYKLLSNIANSLS